MHGRGVIVIRQPQAGGVNRLSALWQSRLRFISRLLEMKGDKKASCMVKLLKDTSLPYQIVITFHAHFDCSKKLQLPKGHIDKFLLSKESISHGLISRGKRIRLLKITFIHILGTVGKNIASCKLLLA